jgi:hypothetical protein
MITKTPRTRQQLVDYLTRSLVSADGLKLRPYGTCYGTWDPETRRRPLRWHGFEVAGSGSSWRGRRMLYVETEVIASMVERGLDTEAFSGSRQLLHFLGETITKADIRRLRKQEERRRLVNLSGINANNARESFAKLNAQLLSVENVEGSTAWLALQDAWTAIESMLPPKEEK